LGTGPALSTGQMLQLILILSSSFYIIFFFQSKFFFSQGCMRSTGGSL